MSFCRLPARDHRSFVTTTSSAVGTYAIRPPMSPATLREHLLLIELRILGADPGFAHFAGVIEQLRPGQKLLREALFASIFNFLAQQIHDEHVRRVHDGCDYTGSRGPHASAIFTPR